jgi:hypothetical protein
MSNLNNNSLLFLVINMKKNKDRWNTIQSSLESMKKKYGCNYIRVEGIDGNNMEKDQSAKDILKPRSYLINKKLTCLESKDEWIYDGTISKSFPGLHLNGHQGTKGLTLSNIKCYYIITKNNFKYNWYCILEDDSEINDDIYKKIINTIHNNNNSDDIIILDKRGRSGTCAVLYNHRIINNLLVDLHPLSNFSINKERVFKRTNLWDYKLWVYLDNFKVKSKTYCIVPSGKFGSVIDI